MNIVRNVEGLIATGTNTHAYGSNMDQTTQKFGSVEKGPLSAQANPLSNEKTEMQTMQTHEEAMKLDQIKDQFENTL